MARQTDQNMDHRTSQIAETVIGHQETDNAAAAHTPTPWRAAHTLYPSEIYATVDGKRFQVADISGAGSQEMDEANANLIVKAVNNHDALVKALTDVLQANDEFRASLPDDWEGDDLQDACIDAREALSRITAAR